MSEISEAEARGRSEARVDALESHAAKVNGSLDRIDGRLGNIERGLTTLAAEKKSVVSLQNRQIALMAAVGTVAYLLLEHVH